MESAARAANGLHTDDDGVERLRDRLLAQAFLFDEPDTYAAGVEDALAEITRLLTPEPAAPAS
jgi:hypothetical protein